jgi:hypothetical protein
MRPLFFCTWLTSFNMMFSSSIHLPVMTKFPSSLQLNKIPLYINTIFAFFPFLLSYYCTGNTLWYLQKFLQYIIVEFTPSIISSLSLSPHSWNGFNRPHFSIFIHEYIIFSPHSPSHTLSLYPSPSHWYQPLDRTCFTFLLSVLEKRHFCLFNIAIQGVLL